jgi:hypothetical protein
MGAAEKNLNLDINVQMANERDVQYDSGKEALVKWRS